MSHKIIFSAGQDQEHIILEITDNGIPDWGFL